MSAKVAVNFLTYTPSMDHPRVKYAKECWKKLLLNLDYEGELLWHIADDGSPWEHVEDLKNLAWTYRQVIPTVSNSQHRGYGANMNMATQVIHPLADIVLPIEEDWELVRQFDISGLVKVLEQASQDYGDPDYIGCIRLGYLGWSNRVEGWLTQIANQTFFRMDAACLETHVFAGHPRLETVEFEKRLGAWPEGIRPGYTEMEVCNRPMSRHGVAWPLDAGINASQDYANLFAHVGEVQA